MCTCWLILRLVAADRVQCDNSPALGSSCAPGYRTSPRYYYSQTSQYRPPNTASPRPQYRHPFPIPNKGFVGYIGLSIPPISEYRRFFVSTEIGGIGAGGGDCTVKLRTIPPLLSKSKICFFCIKNILNMYVTPNIVVRAVSAMAPV